MLTNHHYLVWEVIFLSISYRYTQLRESISIFLCPSKIPIYHQDPRQQALDNQTWEEDYEVSKWKFHHLITIQIEHITLEARKSHLHFLESLLQNSEPMLVITDFLPTLENLLKICLKFGLHFNSSGLPPTTLCQKYSYYLTFQLIQLPI